MFCSFHVWCESSNYWGNQVIPYSSPNLSLWLSDDKRERLTLQMLSLLSQKRTPKITSSRFDSVWRRDSIFQVCVLSFLHASLSSSKSGLHTSIWFDSLRIQSLFKGLSRVSFHVRIPLLLDVPSRSVYLPPSSYQYSNSREMYVSVCITNWHKEPNTFKRTE